MSDAELVQGSPEYFAARIGSFGASRLGNLMAKGQGKTRAAYVLEIVAERLSGQPSGWEGNDDTDEGKISEPLARRAYEELRNVFVQQIGLIRHPVLTYSHASPDGLLEDRGLEIKSHVRFITHLKAIEAPISAAHNYQCQWGMACSGLALWDCGHFCLAAPEHLRLHVREIKRDERVIAELKVEIERAEAEVVAMVARYSKQAA